MRQFLEFRDNEDQRWSRVLDLDGEQIAFDNADQRWAAEIVFQACMGRRLTRWVDASSVPTAASEPCKNADPALRS